MSFFSESLEQGLAELDAIKRADDESSRKLSGKKRSVSKVKGKGTGYGGSAGEGAGKSHKSKSLAMQEQLQNRAAAAADEKQRQVDQQQSGEDLKVMSGFRKVHSSLEKQLDTRTSALASALLGRLEQSPGLVYTMKRLLRNYSAQDIGQRVEVYDSLLTLISAMCDEPFALPFLSSMLKKDSDADEDDDEEDEEEEGSVQSLLRGLAEMSMVFLQLSQGQLGELTKETTLAYRISEVSDKLDRRAKVAREFGLSNTVVASSTASAASASASSSSTSMFGALIGGAMRTIGDVFGGGVHPSNSSSDEAYNAARRRYVRGLEPLRFAAIELCAMVDRGECAHQYYAKGNKAPGGGVCSNPGARLQAVSKEIATMKRSLPCELGSSVFLRCDDENVSVMKALIIGPEGTPYENGCFEFDIYLPPDYPRVPPLVNLVTTGGGTVRFNPNLYNCGKVCLSLLGTWAGPGWIAGKSSIQQVLVSIQSLIFVPDPYFNEPGFQRAEGTPAGRKSSEDYNKTIRLATMRFAIRAPLAALGAGTGTGTGTWRAMAGSSGTSSSSSSVFAEVVREHFSLKAAQVQQQATEWARTTPGITGALNTEIRQLLVSVATPAPAPASASASAKVATTPAAAMAARAGGGGSGGATAAGGSARTSSSSSSKQPTQVVDLTTVVDLTEDFPPPRKKRMTGPADNEIVDLT